MSTSIRTFWQSLLRRDKAAERPDARKDAERAAPPPAPVAALDLAPSDPLIAYLQGAPGVAEVDKLNFDSPALSKLKADGVRLIVPLVNQGELIGLLNLGPRRSEQDYSGEDRGLLANLAVQAAPAVRVAQLVRQQQMEAQERERMEQELRVAQLIQQTLLPRELPALDGWHVAAYYKPARAVGGDFYDFLYLPSGHLGLIIGDVTDKGVPAALVMATTRAILRAAAQRMESPGAVLERANEMLCPDIPPNMFVTCLYAILDPASGHLRYANAGHDLPYRRTADGATELRATGMPLGLMPGMRYEVKELTLQPGESILFYSDGLVEAHNRAGGMFGFPLLKQLVGAHPGGAELIDHLVQEWQAFTGPGWEQEDDTTMVVLQRSAVANEPAAVAPVAGHANGSGPGAPAILAAFGVPSAPGNERDAMRQVVAAVEPLALAPALLERLKTAVSEATMNAIEHGNKNRPDVPVEIQVAAGDDRVIVRITDRGGLPVPEPVAPDLEAKLAGLQSPRGWGLFLIEKMVDEMHVSGNEVHHTLELVLYLKGGDHDRPTA